MRKLAAISMFAAFAMQSQGFIKTKPHFCLDGIDLVGEDCDVIDAPGTSQEIYYAFHRDIETFASVAAGAPTDLEDVILLTQNYTMKAGKYFHKIQAEVDMNSLQNEFTGEKGSGNWINKATIFVKSNKASAVGLASAMARSKVVAHIPLNDGSIGVIGSQTHPANVKPMFDSLTDNATDPRGWEFLITSTDTQPWRFDPALALPLAP